MNEDNDFSDSLVEILTRAYTSYKEADRIKCMRDKIESAMAGDNCYNDVVIVDKELLESVVIFLDILAAKLDYGMKQLRASELIGDL